MRLGGAKGVLMIKRKKDPSDPNSYGMPENIKVQLRHSQLKFKKGDWFLEIIRCATFSQGYLNRQVILLMNSLGVPDDVFKKLLGKALEDLDIKNVLKNLFNVYQSSLQRKKSAKASALELAQELELFFGPSKIFSQIFKYCIIKHFEHQQMYQKHK